MFRKIFDPKFLIRATLLILSICLTAQEESDTLFKYASQQVYENPEISIGIAKELFDKPGATADDKIRAILLISTAYSSKREYEKAMDYALSAMDLLPKLQDVNLRINLLNRIGGLYQELRIYDKAILYLDRALESINKLPEGERKYRNLGINNLLRGFVYRQQMSCDTALNYFEKGIEDYKKFPDSPGGNANISISYYSRGDCLLELGRIDEAERSFIQSLDYAKKAEAVSAIAFAQKGIAQVYTLKEEYKKAIELLTETLHNSENVGDKVLNNALYDALAINYLAIGNYNSYFSFRDKNISIANEIKKTERKAVDDSIRDLMESNSKALQELKKRTRYLQIGLSIIILLVIILMFRTIYTSQRQLKPLSTKLQS